MCSLFRNYCYDYDYCYDQERPFGIGSWTELVCTPCVFVCACVCMRAVSVSLCIGRWAPNIVDWPSSHFCFTTIVAVLRECDKRRRKKRRAGVVVRDEGDEKRIGGVIIINIVMVIRVL
uniref:Uncharacterized protein n=1 Tax=Daphnia magna TaxID=35525 RepID=A0A0P6HKD0_9CRUS